MLGVLNTPRATADGWFRQGGISLSRRAGGGTGNAVAGASPRMIVSGVRLNRFFPAAGLGLVLASASAAQAAEVWVAPDGSDAATGTVAAPFATATRALREVREVRRRDPAKRFEPAYVVVRGGEYPLVEPVFVRPEDSGTNGAPTVIKAAPGERPVFSGGVTLAGWAKLGEFPRGLPGAARGHVWSAPAPTFNGRPLLFRQLWVDGRKAVRARAPNDGEALRLIGWDKPARQAVIPAGALAGMSEVDGAEMVLVQMWEIAVLRLREAAIAGGEARVRFHDPEQRVQFEHPWPPPLVRPEMANGNSPFFLANRIEFLDAPGEWFLDERAGRVYYWPREGENLASARVVAPALETLVEILGTRERPVQHVRFEGIAFQHTAWTQPSMRGHVPLQAGMHLRDAYKLEPKGTPDWRSLDNQGWVVRPPAALTIAHARAVELERCRFEHLGASGVDLVEGVHASRVEGGIFRDIGINGVQLGSFQTGGAETHLPYQPEDLREAVVQVRIANNVLSDTANEDWGGVAIAAGFVRETAIEHNVIQDTSYTAISLGWGWTRTANVMRDNRVHANRVLRFSTRLTDSAGVYTLSNQPGTVVSANAIDTPVISPWAHDANHWGYVYLDEGSSYMLVEDNWSPAEKYIKNANGPDNVWKVNGPAVPESVKENAGLEAEYRDLLEPERRR